MITRINVSLKDTPYTIVIGADILKKLPGYLQKLHLGKDAIIIGHRSIERRHGASLITALKQSGYTVKTFNVPEGEQSKSAVCALSLLKSISHYDLHKNPFIIAFGGGVAGDLAGFVAAIYKRGIPYIQVPTTLLAQIDSSIGGKTAIDLPAGKNLVGAFHQPRLVFTDTTVLQTLNQRQMRNGLAEAIKYGVIGDVKLFEYIQAHHPQCLVGETKVLNFIVTRCARIKADIVSADEKETKGLRTVLNFGHTLGHAVEAAGAYDQYHHGEAVALGMRMAARISVLMGLLSSSHEARINALITDVGLPVQIKGVCLKQILDIMRHDKKFSAGHNRFVLAKEIGGVEVVVDVPMEKIVEAIKVYLKPKS